MKFRTLILAPKSALPNNDTKLPKRENALTDRDEPAAKQSKHENDAPYVFP
jgi:hypothetical protein